MTTTTANASKTALACQRCGEWFYTTQTLPSGAACPICAGKIIVRGIVRQDGHAEHDEQHLLCNAICQSAKGQCCNCKCGGTNHGDYRTVTVTVADGKVSLSLDHPERLGDLAARRLPDIELAESLAAELVDQLEDVFGEVLAKYRTGEWLPGGSFGRVLMWQEYRRAIRHAQKLRTPGGRLRALHRVGEDVAELRQVGR